MRLEISVAASLAVAAAHGSASAQELPVDASDSGRAPAASAAGAFMHHADSPTTEAHRAAFNNQAGYDSTRSGTVELRAELVVVGGPRSAARPLGLSLIAGASYAGPSAHAGYVGQERVNASGGLKLQPLFQARHGFDAALAVRYVSHGFNLSPAVVADLLFSRRIAETQLIFNLGYGQSLAHGDRYGRVRAASLTRLVDELRLGIEGRASFDLGLEDDTPGEAAFDAVVGPFASYALSHLVFSLGGGPSLLRFTDKPGNGGQRDTILLGFMLHAGVGTAL
jgi:hypothetical protein